ncbi:hypothetical protein SAMD00019534_007530 [Acytostelium subglobosum LB1]|uniref:hypothetical protein n=1 Tax=Acytostelium subglobosum LB1 TaxID=1410327 RepID=UPI0006450A2B|nr:hypothetical protein SAMD00019534_007530 [Acytostelium subglobosum LB1]GAM17578.1 hypothetical protein SAMD00019534_007530 [Acytostelium subglobosum LB1]|eukprot:XP_012759640.1 hypothetical protein SAMD00019534_007530 [Acytostelium subglobosum LB1]
MSSVNTVPSKLDTEKINQLKSQSATSFFNNVKPLLTPVEEYKPVGYHLKMVQVITRHGRRTPETTRFPLALWMCNSTDNLIVDRDETRPECSLGQLTVFGTRDLINLGANYRKLLIDGIGYLSKDYKPGEVYVRSSDRERTISSARSLMHGLYGGSFADAQEHMLQAATSFYIRPEAVENIYPRRSCPKYLFLYQLLRKHPAVLEEQKQSGLAEFTTKLQGIFDKSKGSDSPLYISSWRSYAGLVNSFDCFRNHGLPLPDGFTDQIINRMYLEASKEYKQLALFPELSRLGIGRFIGDLSTQLTSKVNNDTATSDLKFAHYSAHDTTLGALLVAYDMYTDNKHPETASSLEFLLFEKDKQQKQQQLQQQQQHFVKVVYNQQVLHIGKCKEFEVDGMCPWDKFMEISKKNTPVNFKEECAISDEEKTRYNIAIQTSKTY